MLEDLKEIFQRVLESNNCILQECNGESDHVHLLIDWHPDNNISALVSSLKSASSRILRQNYKEEIDKFYWGEKAKLWHDSKCIISCGGAPLEIVKQYIQEQSGGRLSNRRGIVSALRSEALASADAAQRVTPYFDSKHHPHLIEGWGIPRIS